MTKQYNKYLIGLADQFDPTNYSAVTDEVRRINEKTHAVPTQFKTEIIISFLKNHSLQNNWIGANPELTNMVASKMLFTGNIEQLFDSCRYIPVFRQALEDYLKEKFA